MSNIPQPTQQHAMIKQQANALLSQFKSTAPRSQFTRTLDHQVRTLHGMIAGGKSQATIDAHLKEMHKTVVNAQRQAYTTHTTPQPGRYTGSQFGRGQPQSVGHMSATTPQTNAHSDPLPSVHALNNAQVALRNMSKIGHGGNPLF